MIQPKFLKTITIDKGMIYLFTPNQRNESYFEGAFTALFIKFAIFLASVKNILQDKS